MELREHLAFEDPCVLVERRYDAARNATHAGLFLIGNGYLGYRGTLADQRASDSVGLVLTDTYDNADGTWTELCTVPNPLYTTIEIDGRPFDLAGTDRRVYRRGLDVSRAVWTFRTETDAMAIEEQRFAPLERRHVLARRFTFRAKRNLGLSLTVGIDGRVCSVHGRHLVEQRGTINADTAWIVARTSEHGYGIAVAARSQVAVGAIALLEPVRATVNAVDHRLQLPLPVGQTLVLDTFAVVGSSNDLTFTTTRPGSRPESLDPLVAHLHDRLDAAESVGYEALLAEHTTAWSAVWERHDVTIAGAELVTAALRFDTYRNVIVTPRHTDHLPIEVRGLSRRPYRTAAFQDQERCNLPMFMYSDPASARNALVYRYKTLAGARRNARRLGYRGAYYAWVSADTGDEICPPCLLDGVSADRRMHVSLGIAHAIARYVRITGDDLFLLQYGAEILFEIARLLHSCGSSRPDEYLDNAATNRFTNYRARFAADYAVRVYEQLAERHPDSLRRITATIELDAAEPDAWRDVAARPCVPEPQPDSVPADVVQLFALHPDAFDPEVVARPGNVVHAERSFSRSLMIDLVDTDEAVGGGVCIGGIDTATCGAGWQIAVLGFAGLREIEGGYTLRPHLPATWDGIAFSVKRFGRRVRVEVARRCGRISVTWRADPANPEPLQCGLDDRVAKVAPGTELTLER